MHRLLLGPYRSGKTGAVLRDLLAAKQEYPFDRCLILVPSQRYGALVRAQLAELFSANGQPGLFGLEIATIYGACENILRSSGQHPIVIPRDLCAAVVAMAINEAKENGELENLAPISSFAGTSQAILRLLDEFERAALTPSQVITATQTTAAAESKYAELAAIYRRYWKKLDSLKCTDQKRMAFDCRERLSRRDSISSQFRLRWLLVDGFDRISPLQAEVIQALSLHAAETHIAFDYIEPQLRTEDQTSEYSWKDSSFAELSKRFPGGIVYSKEISSTPPAQQHAFRTLDPQFEMIEIARRCKAAIMDRDVKPRDILVVARDINEYATSARAAFDEARIPYSIDQSLEFKELPLFKLLLKIAQMAQNDFVRSEVCETLRSPFFDLQTIGLTRQQADSIDKKSIEMGVVSGREQWEKFLIANFSEHVATSMLSYLDMLSPPKAATVSNFCRWLEGLENVAIRKHIHLSSAQPEEIEAIQGFRTVIRNLIQQQDLFNHDEVIPAAHFLTMLNSTADALTFRRNAPDAECICICAAEHAPNKRFDEVFIAGVTEGRFPKHSGESGFVSAEERGRWSIYGIVLTNPREEAGFEKALFRSLIERARKRVYFSIPEFTAGGDEAIPSFFLSDGTCSIERPEHIRPALQALRRPVSAREAVGGWLWMKPGIELSERLSRHPATDEFWHTINISVLAAYQRHQKNSSNAYNGYLVDLTQSHWLEVKLPAAWSASALNNYGQCPFKFWLSNLLDVEPREEPQSGLRANVKGKLYHKALELYYSELLKNPQSDQRELLKDSLLKAIAGMQEDPEFTPGPYWENEQKDMLFRLNRFIDYDRERLNKTADGPTPALLETRFGMQNFQESYPPLILNSEHGPIVIRGVIDRIDIRKSTETEPATATVIDYKTSSTPIPVADAHSGINIQLPLYALAVNRSILPNARVSTGHYLSINAARSIGSIEFGSEKAQGLLEATEKMVINHVASIRSGDFSVRPASSKMCKNCLHKPVCRITDLTRTEAEEF